MPYAFAATRPVNPPGAEPVLTEEQLWKGLEYKARNPGQFNLEFWVFLPTHSVNNNCPQPFIPFISASKTTFEEGNKLVREVTLANPDHSILTESIETYAPTIVYFEMKETGLRVTNTISYGPADELLLTYSFANGIPGVAADKPKPSAKELNAGVDKALERSLSVIRGLGVQFYGLCYIEGAVDFIFGQSGHAFFHRNTIVTIASVDGGAITADGPDTADLGLYVINLSTLTTSTATTTNLTGKVFLGRPWSAAAQVVYISTNMGVHINPAGWEPWSTAEPNTSGVLFAEFGSIGPGAAGTRASLSKKLTSAAGFGIADVLGANWATWVDTTYVT
ncbi:pectin lyase fold/virulence factor [Mycena olivaceomarginata]|nr:pectin lyase fold/virulence factor [Mycena olivaceomarginata]